MPEQNKRVFETVALGMPALKMVMAEPVAKNGDTKNKEMKSEDERKSMLARLIAHIEKN